MWGNGFNMKKSPTNDGFTFADQVHFIAYLLCKRHKIKIAKRRVNKSIHI